jgi:hypothetical protein
MTMSDESTYTADEVREAVEFERKRLLDEIVHVRQLDFLDLKQKLQEPPVTHPMERRAISLKFAIDSAGRHFDFRTDADNEAAQMQMMTTLVLQRAEEFEKYLTGATDDDH